MILVKYTQLTKKTGRCTVKKQALCSQSKVLFKSAISFKNEISTLIHLCSKLTLNREGLKSAKRFDIKKTLQYLRKN